MSQVHIFVSYSHDDARWFADDKLMPRLIKSLEVIGAEVWYDHRRLGGGDPWKQEIVDAIKKAHVAVLLVSRNFLNSDFIREIELPRIERRFDMGELIVVPILVGHCNWQNVRLLSRPQMVPGKPTPLISYLDSPAEWDRVQEEIFSAIERQVDRVREKYHMDAPVRRESMIDPSATITRLSGALPRIPVQPQIEESASPVRDKDRGESTRGEASRREKSEYDTQPRHAPGSEGKKSSGLKTILMPVAAAGLAALVTAGILLRGTLFGGDAPAGNETVQAQDVVTPAQQGIVAPAVQPAPGQQAPVPQPAIQVQPAPAPVIVPSQPTQAGMVPGAAPTQQTPPPSATGPTTPMPASTPGTTSAQPVPGTVSQTPSAEPAAPSPSAEQAKPANVTQPKSTQSAPKPATKPAPKPAAPPPPPKKPANVLEDAAHEILQQQLDKLKR